MTFTSLDPNDDCSVCRHPLRSVIDAGLGSGLRPIELLGRIRQICPVQLPAVNALICHLMLDHAGVEMTVESQAVPRS
jgi:hypothetical protein